jgi:hypothetical protein
MAEITEKLTTFAWVAHICAEYKHITHTLNQFRRHPEWKLAFATVAVRYADLFETMPDGRQAMSEATAKRMIEYADQEFIESLVRRGY